MASLGNLFTGGINVTAIADNTVVSAVAARRIVVLSYTIINNVATAQTVTWKTNATAISGPMNMSVAGVPITATGDRMSPVLMTNPGEALNLALTAATQVGGHITWYLDGAN